MTDGTRDRIANIGAGMVPTYHATESVEEAKAVVEQCKTSTERLRAMLDERGVRWKRKRGRKHDGTEWHDQFGVYAEAVQEYSWDGFEHPEGKLLVRHGVDYLTPAQAIAATLGAGTCTDIGRYCFTCSECGWAANEPHHALGGFWPTYCPNCGRRVVDE